VKPAAVAAGVASLALVGGIVAVNLTSGSGGDTADAGPGPTAPSTTGSTDVPSSGAASPSTAVGSSTTAGSGSSTQSSSPQSSAPSSAGSSSAGSASALAGSWTGTIDGGGDPVGTRITLDGDASALTGQLLFADPDSSDWVPAGTVTAALSGASLHLQTDTQAVLSLTVDGDALSGNGTLTSTDNPFPVTVSLKRD